MTIFRGTRSADSLFGGGADDQIYGLAGNDTLAGYGGADLLQGGVGADSLAGYAFWTADSDADTLYGAGGNDFIEAGANDVADGGDGDDTIRVNGESPASLAGGLGYDTLQVHGDISSSALSGFERLEAALPNSPVVLTTPQLASFDVVGGAAGQTTVTLYLNTVGRATVAFDPALASAEIVGSGVELSLVAGTETRFTYSGWSGNDTITGGDGDDRLFGRGGSDTLRGGAGDDRLFAGNRAFAPTDDEVDPDWLFGASGNDSLWGAANDSLYGGTGDDELVAMGVALLDGGAGDDWFQAFSSEDTIDGGAGNDTVTFEKSSDDVVVDLSDPASSITGIETLISSRGDTAFTGTENRETFEIALGNDTVDGGGGGDTVSYAKTFSDVVVNPDVVVDLRIVGPQDTGAGIDTLIRISNLIGGGGNDALTGGVGANVLEGGAGNDVLDGRIGVDLADYAHAGAGVQVRLAVAGAQNTRGAGIDSLISMEDLRGSDFADGLAGNAAANRLYGGGGNDVIVGAENNDTLTGGLGADRMRGGTGFDTFDFNATAESTRAAPDLILDFLGAGATWGDLIDLSTIDANATVAGNQAFAFGSGGAGGLSLVEFGSDTLVRGNTDADAAFEFALLLRDGGRPASAYADVDFVL